VKATYALMEIKPKCEGEKGQAIQWKASARLRWIVLSLALPDVPQRFAERETRSGNDNGF
jgi:hypothetical protein